jgi:hypothetical protein
MNPQLMQLRIQHQEVVFGVPSIVNYEHGRQQAPELSLLKIYDGTWNARYFIIYIQINASNISVTSTPEHCPNALTLIRTGMSKSLDYVTEINLHMHTFYPSKIYNEHKKNACSN